MDKKTFASEKLLPKEFPINQILSMIINQGKIDTNVIERVCMNNFSVGVVFVITSWLLFLEVLRVVITQ